MGGDRTVRKHGMDRDHNSLPALGQARLVDQVDDVIRLLRCSARAEQDYVDEDRCFILLHGKWYGGGEGGVSDPSRGQRQRPVAHTELRAGRHRVDLLADIERRIRLASG